MATPFVGEIKLFGGTFAPVGWAVCDGALLPIAEYDTLFNLIGTTYGGDGQATFALPDLRGRVPLHHGPLQGGSTYQLGETGGVESVTLTRQQMPKHSHGFAATTAVGTQPNPGNNLMANSQGPQPYIQENPDGNLNPKSIGETGGGGPHENRQPLLTLNFIISLFGIYPSPT